MKRLYPFWASLVVFLSTAFPAPPVQAADVASIFDGKGISREKVIASLVETFDQVVFQSEIDTKMNQAVIAKWRGPVGIALQGRPTQQLATFLQTHLRTLSKLTGVRFSQVKSDDPQQKITYAFVKRAEMTSINIPGVSPDLIRKLGRGGGCYFLSFKKPADRIVFAIIVVNIERDIAHLNSCLLEETTQSLGLPNDQNIMRPSIFSDLDRITELSPMDVALVRALYDSRMTAGLPRTQALETARQIFSDMAENAR